MDNHTPEKHLTLTEDLSTENLIMEYGISISGSDGILFECRSISDDKTFVEKLAALLVQPDVSPVHYADIIEDAVSEQTLCI